MLGAADIRSHPYGSGVDFLDALPDLEPGCILLDLRMPQMDGFHVMAALADRNVDWPFIVKPFSEEALLTCFDQAFGLLEEREVAGLRRREAHDRAALLTGREKEVL